LINKENRENLREQRLKHKELDKLKSYEDKEKPLESNFSSMLEKFNIIKNKEN